MGGILLKNADPPLDDFNLTITWDDGGGPCKCIEAWDGVNWTPLAQVMSGSMCGRAWPCMAVRPLTGGILLKNAIDRSL